VIDVEAHLQNDVLRVEWDVKCKTSTRSIIADLLSCLYEDCVIAAVIAAAELLASSEPEVFNMSSSGVLTCSFVFSGPERGSLTDSQFPQLGMTLAGSQISTERAPLNYTYQPPMHYIVRVSVT